MSPFIGNRSHLLRRGRSSLPGYTYHVTATTMHREAVFSDFRSACAGARCFDSTALLGDATMLAWVLMPDHAHWLMRLGAHDSLACVVNRLKSASARVSNQSTGRSGAVWSRGYFDRALRTDDHLATVARYLIANPVRAGLVNKVGSYPFWDAASFL